MSPTQNGRVPLLPYPDLDVIYGVLPCPNIMSSPPRPAKSTWERIWALFIQPEADSAALERSSRGRRNSSGLLVHVDGMRNTLFQQFNRKRSPGSKDDVYRAWLVLRRKLPEELLLDIFERAEYWLKKSTIRSDRDMIVQRTSGRPYVISHPIMGNGKRPVRKVIFTIKSHDQGWSDDSQHHGTYAHSWTWFEARVVDKDGIRQDVDEMGALRLMYNVHASREVRTHTITCDSQQKNVHGAWVRRLRLGESIAVVPMARYPLWENHVISAQIEVYTSALR